MGMWEAKFTAAIDVQVSKAERRAGGGEVPGAQVLRPFFRTVIVLGPHNFTITVFILESVHHHHIYTKVITTTSVLILQMSWTRPASSSM